MVIVWNFLQEDTEEISDKSDSSAILGSWKVWGMSSTTAGFIDYVIMVYCLPQCLYPVGKSKIF
jgi:hypothetical protein